MLTLHLEAASHPELVRIAARALGLVLNEAAVGPAPAQEVAVPAPAGVAPGPETPEEVAQPRRRGRKPQQTPLEAVTQPPADAASTGGLNPESATDTPVKTDPPAEAPAQNPAPVESPAQAPTLEAVRAAGSKVMEKHGIKRVTEIVLKETGMTRMSAAHAAGHGAKIIAAFEQAVAA